MDEQQHSPAGEKLQKVLARCRVKVVTAGLSAEQLRHCRVEPAPSVEAEVRAIFFPAA